MIFGLRFTSNAAIQPTTQELEAFLESPRAPGAAERHRDDLETYTRALSGIDAFKSGRSAGPADIHERILIGILAHSRFFNPLLRVAIGEYKYYLQQLAAIDLRKPAAFLRSAEEEMRKLNPKKREDQHKISRLQGLIDQRSRDRNALMARWRMITGELLQIAVYVRENLHLIRDLCTASLDRLAGMAERSDKEVQLLDDLKSHFKERVKDARQNGKITPEYLETMKAVVAGLSGRFSSLVREDLSYVSAIYAAVRDQVAGAAGRLESLAARGEKLRKEGAAIDGVFAEIETVLVALVAKSPDDLRPPVPQGPGGEHEGLIMDLRKEMLAHVLEQMGRPGPAPS